MSSNNPDITAADVITDVETRLGDTNLDATDYLPWISYSYQKVYHAIVSAGQQAKEKFFEDNATIALDVDTLEKDISTDIPLLGSISKIEVKYGASGDTWNPATKLPSTAHWANLHNVSTQYRNKTNPLYNITGNNLLVIPVAPESGAVAYVRYIKRPYQLTASTDIIDLPYRYIYAVIDYVHARAIVSENEDFAQAQVVENNFQAELAKITELVVNEFNENDGTSAVQVDTTASIFSNPLRIM